MRKEKCFAQQQTSEARIVNTLEKTEWTEVTQHLEISKLNFRAMSDVVGM